MRHLTDGSSHGRTLEFSAQIQTRSTNYGIHTIKSKFTLQSEASLSLSGLVLFRRREKRNKSSIILQIYHVVEK